MCVTCGGNVATIKPTTTKHVHNSRWPDNLRTREQLISPIKGALSRSLPWRTSTRAPARRLPKGANNSLHRAVAHWDIRLEFLVGTLLDCQNETQLHSLTIDLTGWNRPTGGGRPSKVHASKRTLECEDSRRRLSCTSNRSRTLRGGQ